MTLDIGDRKFNAIDYEVKEVRLLVFPMVASPIYSTLEINATKSIPVSRACTIIFAC